jgi:hypothetical protein
MRSIGFEPSLHGRQAGEVNVKDLIAPGTCGHSAVQNHLGALAPNFAFVFISGSIPTNVLALP